MLRECHFLSSLKKNVPFIDKGVQFDLQMCLLHPLLLSLLMDVGKKISKKNVTKGGRHNEYQ